MSILLPAAQAAFLQNACTVAFLWIDQFGVSESQVFPPEPEAYDVVDKVGELFA